MKKVCQLLTMSSMMLVFSGCVSTKPLPLAQNAIVSSNAKTLKVIQRQQHKFIIQTPTKAMLNSGLMTAFAVNSLSNDVAIKYHIVDPAVYIREKLATSLALKENLIVTQAVETSTTTNIDKLSQENASSDLLLDVFTGFWGANYFSLGWGTYTASHTTTFRLIDTKTRKVISKGVCKNEPIQKKDGVSYKELLANNAQWIKTHFQTSAEACVTLFEKQALQI
ncbi:MAG: hypothetical protein QM666_08945 [Acinetobacter sp.]